ncbi:Hypothetical predicted protein, partial [Pelobates cultripes]
TWFGDGGPFVYTLYPSREPSLFGFSLTHFFIYHRGDLQDSIEEPWVPRLLHGRQSRVATYRWGTAQDV